MTLHAVRPEVDPRAPRSQPSRAPLWTGPLSGLLAAAVALCVGLFVASVINVDSPLEAVGSEFIDHTPKWLKIRAIDWFGTHDKLALRVGMVITIGLISLVVGAIARRWPTVGVAAIGVFGIVGAIVAVGRPDGSGSSAVAPLVGAVVGGALIWYLIGLVRAGDGATSMPKWSRIPDGWDRRRFMVTTGGAAGVAIIATAVSRKREHDRIIDLEDAAPDSLPPVAASAGADGGLGTVTSAAPTIPATATLSPLTPFITPNDDFYLIDTALSVPRINLNKWTVSVGGRVNTPISLSYADLLARPQVERVITIACVSNEVGGDLIGNAVWQGVLLADILNEAGVQPEAQQVFSTSVDGWNSGFPIEVALDGRDAMIAIGMNGKPLPPRHGFPARLIVPGVYGYVSATKWLSKIELTTWDEAVGYWVPRGWSRDAPVKTQSRIDVPRRNDDLKAGPVPIAGIAWAQHRGIAKVEVRIDDGPWNEATLATDVTDDTWRQWLYQWDATSGDHTIQVRATDNDGQTQTDEVSRPDPDGATGWHTRKVSVA
ncbi:MAG: putative rane-bound oxidoreductase [Ilumatobacteraceae bacterium]|nr:putative rane-bound oxidoreductase [Ilumatobacteraceae bacterium]